MIETEKDKEHAEGVVEVTTYFILIVFAVLLTLQLILQKKQKLILKSQMKKMLPMQAN